MPKGHRGRQAASGGDGSILGDQDAWVAAAAAGDGHAGNDSSYPYQQQQQEEELYAQQQQQVYAVMPDPNRLANLAIREQQLAALQGVRMELESFRLLSDQVRRREKFKVQVWCDMCVFG